VTLNGTTKPLDASVLGVDTTTDLALLKISGASGLTPAALGSSSAVHVGDDVVAIGNALALEGGPTVTKGIISGVGRSLDEATSTMSGLLQTDASISSGNSGGPLIDATGSVIGINTAVAASSRSTSAENVGFAIAIDTARPVIDRLRTAAPASSLAAS
jgi:putative serine protease PepD